MRTHGKEEAPFLVSYSCQGLICRHKEISCLRIGLQQGRQSRGTETESSGDIEPRIQVGLTPLGLPIT